MHYSFHISSIFEHESCGKITSVEGSALKFHEGKSFLESLQLTLCLVFIKFKRGLGPTYAIARAARSFFRIVPLKEDLACGQKILFLRGQLFKALQSLVGSINSRLNLRGILL